VVGITHCGWVAAVPGVRIGCDHSFGYLGLSEEEPTPPRGCKPGVGSINVLADRQTIEKRELTHHPRVVERKAKSVVAAAIVSHEIKLMVAQTVHRSKQVARAGSFRVRPMVRGRRRLVGPAIAGTEPYQQ